MRIKPLLCLMAALLIINNAKSYETGTIIYFYSSTCSECQISSEFLDKLAYNHDIQVKKYNISNKEGIGLFTIYCNEYKINDDERVVPAIFIGETALIGHKEIITLEKDIKRLTDYKTPIYTYDKSKLYSHPSNIKILGLMIAGFVNGLNPCSFAMFLFLISLITVKKDKFLKITTVFIFGKFITFLLLGTLLFGFLSYINLSFFQSIMKIIMLIFIVSLILLNAFDLAAVKKNNYNKIKLQLPKKIRHYNQNLLKKITCFLDDKRVIFVVLFISFCVSLTEFMCTGQIYLISIVSLLQLSDTINLNALVYLVIYNIFLILPLIITTFILYQGKNVLFMAEQLDKNIPLIKLLNIILLFVILLMIILL